MKKIFLLIPVLALSLMVNATKTTIDNSSADALRLALYYSSVGDTIVMTAGTYEESNSDYIAWKRDNVVMAAEGANVTIKPHVSFRVRNGARGKLIGVKIDASKLNENDPATSYENIFEAGDATDGNRLILENCEIYGNVSKTMLRCASDKKLDSLIINNCYIHNNAQVILRLESASLKGLTVTNSTFANIANGGSFWVAPMEIKSAASGAKVIVDHCTFYNVQSISLSYGLVNVGSGISDATVSNCIFMLPATADMCATNLQGGGDIKNTLTYNYDNWQECGHYETATLTNCFKADPLFNDLANNRYTYDGNWVTMSISPARGAATDGSDLGDPRWYTTPTLPETNFASPYQFKGDKAVLTGNIWYDDVNDYIYGNGGSNKVYGTATWKFKALKAGIVEVAVNLNSGNTSGHKLRVEVRDADGNSVGEFAEQTSTLPGTLSIPVVGDYTVILHDDQEWSSAKIDNVTFSYIGGAVQNMPGTTDIDEAWFSAGATRASGKISFPEGKQDEGWVKWNVAFASSANFNVNLNVYSNNGKKFTVALLDADGNNAVTPLYKNGGDKDATDPVTLEMGAMTVPAGNYTLMVTNAEAWSDAEVISVQFVPAGGGLVDIPDDNIPFSEAILSGRAFIDENGEIRFTTDAEHSHVTEESVKWRLNVSKEGYYKFTPSVNSNNGHSYLVSVYNADETVLKGFVAQSGDDIWGAPKTFSTDNIYLEEGEYRLIIQNTTPNSNGRIVSISASYEGGAIVNVPNNAIPFADAILNGGATRDLVNNPNEIHFESVDAYAQWNIHATAGLYTFTFAVVGSDYGKYKLTIIDDADNTIYEKDKGLQNSGSVTHSNILIEAGDYTIKVANVSSGSHGYITNIAATAATDVFILDDNKADDGSIAAAAGNTYTFLLKRSLEADRYYTICIPVGSWDSELGLAFGDGYELWQMTSATQSGDEIDLNFEKINGQSFHAGWPYIIKPSVAVQNPIFYNKKEIENHTYNNTQSFDAADFIGTFYKSEIPAGENNLYLQNNNLYYSESNATPIKGTRAWIRIKTAGGASGVRARIVLGGQVATSINLINGEMVNGTVKTIENGQLIIIRDGVRYNALGTRIQ